MRGLASVGRIPPGAEVERSCKQPGSDDRHEQKTDRRAEKDPEVDAAALLRLLRPVMGHQRIGRERQQLVEEEQREQVRCERHPHGPRERDGEEDVETRLVLLVVTSHVADRIDRRDDPKEAGQQTEEQAEGLHLEREEDARKRLAEHQTRPLSPDRLRRQVGDEQEQNAGGDQGSCLA